jgi:hypothetical protein
MDFSTRELRFGLNDKSKFDAIQVAEALKREGFPDVELKLGPS